MGRDAEILFAGPEVERERRKRKGLHRYGHHIVGMTFPLPICHKSPWTRDGRFKKTGRTVESLFIFTFFIAFAVFYSSVNWIVSARAQTDNGEL